MRDARRGIGQRGMTLTEVVIVTVLAALVVVALLGFYINSQATWTDGSTQALAQRDATMLVAEITAKAHASAGTEVFDLPDSLHQTVVFYDPDLNEIGRFWWNDANSLVHQGIGLTDNGPVVASKVTRFQLDTLSRLVSIRVVELVTADGKLVRQTAAAALYNQ